MQPVDYSRQTPKTHVKLFCAMILMSIKCCNSYSYALSHPGPLPGLVTMSDTKTQPCASSRRSQGTCCTVVRWLPGSGSPTAQAALQGESANSQWPELAAAYSAHLGMANQRTAEKI